MVRPAFTLIALFLTLEAVSLADAPPAMKRSRVGITTHDGSKLAVAVELATNDDERSLGLMNRKELPADDGMLFIFDQDRDQTFWMHNTLIPLDMVFIAADGTIVGIVRSAKPQTDTPRSVKKPSRYVLEVNGGWTQAKGVHTGDKVTLGEALAAAR